MCRKLLDRAIRLSLSEALTTLSKVKVMIYLIAFVLLLGMFWDVARADIKSDLISYWKFDDGSGTIARDSAGSNNGTLKGDAKWAEGWIGSAIELDGDDDYVDCGQGIAFNSVCRDVITLAAWVKVTHPEGPEWSGIIIRGYGDQFGNVDPYDTFAMYYHGPSQTMGFKTNSTSPEWMAAPNNSAMALFDGGWHHTASVYDGAVKVIYLDGVEIVKSAATGRIGIGEGDGRILIGGGRDIDPMVLEVGGFIDEARIYDRALTQEEIVMVMESIEDYPYASGPQPPLGALHMDTWVTLSWRPGDFAISHDVYLGGNFNDVNEATRDSDLFRSNQALTFYVAGFPGYAYPDGLIPGTTYYWRIDEVNEAEPNSPWKGEVWSFSIPSKSAYSPIPANGAELVDLNVELTWTPGLGAKLHYIVFGDDYEAVSSAGTGTRVGPAKFSPGLLELAKTYYWRVDESDGLQTYKGEVWSFTTEGAVTGPNPVDGAKNVSGSQILKWVAGAVAASHEVYFGTDADAVKNATKASPEYKGSKALGEESYNPGILLLNTAYYWRIDEVNGTNPLSPWKGNVWSFTTGNYFVIDDFEDYNTGANQIWFAWHDGLGAGSPGTPGYIPGNGTGSAVGDENTLSYTEETIIHGGGHSMPLAYDNNKQGFSKYSEVELTLSNVRNWTLDGVGELSLWFRGYPAKVGSFAEGPTGTYTMVGSGADIWNAADEFHYAFKTLTGVGSIVAKVQSVGNTNNWAKAGVMIRETLEPGSKHALMVVTPAQGVSFQRRVSADGASTDTTTAGIVAPQWVKIERDLSGNFRASYSANGSTWTLLGTENIQMTAMIYIGLAVTSHDAALACQAVISNVTTTGNVGPQWAHQDIGIESNDTEPLYLAISNTAGNPVVVTHDDPAAANIDVWTEWVIPLQSLADQGLNLSNVDKIAIGLGTRGNMTVPGGKGKMYFDDIRLYRTALEPESEPQP
jgi:hypothetical protein